MNLDHWTIPTRNRRTVDLVNCGKKHLYRLLIIIRVENVGYNYKDHRVNKICIKNGHKINLLYSNMCIKQNNVLWGHISFTLQDPKKEWQSIFKKMGPENFYNELYKTQNSLPGINHRAYLLENCQKNRANWGCKACFTKYNYLLFTGSKLQVYSTLAHCLFSAVTSQNRGPSRVPLII